MPQGIASVSENEVAICFRTGFCLKPVFSEQREQNEVDKLET